MRIKTRVCEVEIDELSGRIVIIPPRGESFTVQIKDGEIDSPVPGEKLTWRHLSLAVLRSSVEFVCVDKEKVKNGDVSGILITADGDFNFYGNEVEKEIEKMEEVICANMHQHLWRTGDDYDFLVSLKKNLPAAITFYQNLIRDGDI